MIKIWTNFGEKLHKRLPYRGGETKINAYFITHKSSLASLVEELINLRNRYIMGWDQKYTKTVGKFWNQKFCLLRATRQFIVFQTSSQIKQFGRSERFGIDNGFLDRLLQFVFIHPSGALSVQELPLLLLLLFPLSLFHSPVLQFFWFFFQLQFSCHAIQYKCQCNAPNFLQTTKTEWSGTVH